MLCIRDCGEQVVFSQDPVLARFMRSNPYNFGKGSRLWTYSGCTVRPVVDEKREPVSLLDSEIKNLDPKYLIERTVLVIYIQDSTNKKKIILVPGTDSFHLVNDDEKIGGLINKLTKKKVDSAGKPFEEKKKVYDFGKYVDESGRFLYSLKRIILTHEELLLIWPFLVDEKSINYRSVIACSKNCMEADFITKSENRLSEQRIFLNQYGLKFDDLTNSVLGVSIV